MAVNARFVAATEREIVYFLEIVDADSRPASSDLLRSIIDPPPGKSSQDCVTGT